MIPTLHIALTASLAYKHALPVLSVFRANPPALWQEVPLN